MIGHGETSGREEEPGVARRLAGLCLRSGLLLLAAWILIILPMPRHPGVLHYKNAIVSFFTVVLLGKALYDTLFEMDQ